MKKFAYITFAIAAAAIFALNTTKHAKACGGTCDTYVGPGYISSTYSPVATYGNYYYSAPYYYYYNYPYYYAYNTYHPYNYWHNNYRPYVGNYYHGNEKYRYQDRDNRRFDRDHRGRTYNNWWR